MKLSDVGSSLHLHQLLACNANAVSIARQNPLGTDVGEGLEDKKAFRNPGVGQGQHAARQRDAVTVEEVQVDRAGGVVEVIGGAPKLALDRVEAIKKIVRSD